MKKIFVKFGLFVFKKSRVQAPRERPAANNVRAIRVRIKNRVKSACKKLFVSFGLFVFKNIVFKHPVSVSPRTKIRAIREIRVHIKNRVKSVCVLNTE